MRITYLAHSGFMVSTPDVIMVFDYSHDPAHNVVKELKRRPDTPVIFFVSSHNSDHYNEDIFNLGQDHNRTYILSNDVEARDTNSRLAIQGMSAGDVVENLPGGVSVKAYSSTAKDKGVAFDVTLKDGRKVFHAGQLNNWHYMEDTTPQEKAHAESLFTSAVNRIAEENSELDVVFFPVDVREGADFASGAAQFVDTVNVKNFFPMHFDGSHEQACDFANYPLKKKVDTKFHGLYSPGMSTEVS